MTPGQFPLIVNRYFSAKTTKDVLDEDAIPNVSPEWDPDEIRFRVEIQSLLPTVVAFSNQEELGLLPAI